MEVKKGYLASPGPAVPAVSHPVEVPDTADPPSSKKRQKNKRYFDKEKGMMPFDTIVSVCS